MWSIFGPCRSISVISPGRKCGFMLNLSALRMRPLCECLSVGIEIFVLCLKICSIFCCCFSFTFSFNLICSHFPVRIVSLCECLFCIFQFEFCLVDKILRTLKQIPIHSQTNTNESSTDRSNFNVVASFKMHHLTF